MSGLFRVPIFDDEILPSFVSRLARANGNVAFMFCKDLGVDYDRVVRGDLENVKKLSEVCGIPSEKLAHHSVGLVESLQVKLLGVTLEKPSVVKGTMRFCPDCFREDEENNSRKPGLRKYMRAAWLVREIRACPRHDREIVSLEPTVGSRYVDFCETLDRRANEILDQSAAASRMICTPAEHFIFNTLGGGKSYGELLDALDLRIAIHVARRLGVALDFPAAERLKELSPEENAAALESGFQHLLRGERGFTDALDQVIKAQGSPTLGLSPYGKLYKAFMIKSKDLGYERIWKVIRKHAEKNVSLPGLTPSEDDGRQWTSLSAIIRATGLDKRFIKRRLQDYPDLVTVDGMISAKANDIFSNIARPRLNVPEAARTLGCSKSIFLELEEMGLLTRCDIVSNSPRIARQHRMFFEADILGFRKELFNHATAPPRDDLQSIERIARMFELTHSRLIADIFLGHFEIVASCNKQSLVQALMLDPAHFEPKYRLDGHASTTEACRLLDVNTAMLGRLLDTGVIPFTPHPLMGRRKMIALSDIENFNKRYVRLSRVGAMENINAQMLSARCKKRGIKPALSREMAGQAFFVLKEDVARILADD